MNIKKIYVKGKATNQKSDWKELDGVFDHKHAHGIRISFPFTGDLSKNNMHRSRWGGMYWGTATAAARQMVTLKVKSMRHEFFIGKVWLKILAQMPTHAGDAINMLDIIADGVKDAIGVDDRWFCVESIDWQIVKKNPCIMIWVKQDIQEHHQLCSACGEIKPLRVFSPAIQRRTLERKRVGTKFCNDCRNHSAKVDVKIEIEKE